MSSTEQVWIVDDDHSMRWVLSRALERADMRVASFETAEALLGALETARPDAVVTDIRMPGMDGFGLAECVAARDQTVPIIIMTAYSDLDSAVSAYQAGAFEYLPKPFDVDEAVDLVRRAIANRASSPEGGRGDQVQRSEVLGSAPAMQEVFRAVGRLSRSNMTVLITGESGTGKELVARALHDNGMRSIAPFIALNMAAIPADLLESELFGHERGAFTGADSRRIGRFEQADGGTLFLDEIGDMPAYLQTRLLRVLSDGEFYRVGGRLPLQSNVRVVAATHQDMERQVARGDFREDLYHRLNVVRVRVPPLRERVDDVPELAHHFLSMTAAEMDEPEKTLTADAVAYLESLPWPGNVRQLENVCRWLTVMAPGRVVGVEDLPPELLDTPGVAARDGWHEQLRQWASQKMSGGEHGVLDKALPEFERVLIEVALQYSGGRRQTAAKLLGWGRNTLTRKIQNLFPKPERT